MKVSHTSANAELPYMVGKNKRKYFGGLVAHKPRKAAENKEMKAYVFVNSACALANTNSKL